MKVRDEIRILEMEIDRLEDPAAREVLERLLKILKAQQSDIEHFWDYAQGVH